MTEIRIEVDDASRRTLEALDELGDILSRLPSNRQALQEIGNSIRAGIARNFDEESAGDEYPWADLARSTQIERQLQGYPPRHPILERSGEYRSSFTEAGHPLHYVGVQTTAAGFTVEIGSEDERAETLEYGTDLIPPRAATYLGEEDLQHLTRVLFDLILEQINAET
jgi:hypothetical protein